MKCPRPFDVKVWDSVEVAELTPGKELLIQTLEDEWVIAFTLRENEIILTLSSGREISVPTDTGEFYQVILEREGTFRV